jgi:hypothetical protein
MHWIGPSKEIKTAADDSMQTCSVGAAQDTQVAQKMTAHLQ